MAKTPRTNKYEAILARLFEVTIVLSIIKPVAGPRTLNNPDDSTLMGCQRRLLTNLAFILDHDKGGDSTTSVAIQNEEKCFKFWIASNEEPGEKIAAFLRKILEQLKPYSKPHRDSDATKIAQKCCAFAKKRIMKELKMLYNHILKCEKDLNEKTFDVSEKDKASLTEWLLKAKFDKSMDPFQVCEIAFGIRNDPQMRILFQLGQESTADSNASTKRSPFLVVRHYIGRLAARIRVAEQLLEDSRCLPELFDVFEIGRVKPPDCVPPPKADAQTNLEAILGRLIPSQQDENREEYTRKMNTIDEAIGLSHRIDHIYAEEKVKPRVHSEIQMLEMFYRDKLEYANNYPFIGTSKPACLCCKLYFRYHPANCEAPDSHQRIYTNWGPILLPKGMGDARFQEQRSLLGKVRSDLRDIALDHIINQRMVHVRPANSVTALTCSEYDLREMDGLSDVEDELLGSDGSQDVYDATVRHDEGLDDCGENVSTEEDSDSDGGVKL